MSKVKLSARDRILNTASELFQERGYTEIGINEIIAKSGTAKATFYSNFASKEILGEAWLKSLHNKSVHHHQELIEGGMAPRDSLIEYFQQLETFLLEGAYRGCPYTNTKAVIKCDEVLLDKQVLHHKESIRSFFRSLAKLSGLTTKTSQQLGDQIFILYSGATAESQNLKDVWPVAIAKSTAIRLWDLAQTK